VFSASAPAPTPVLRLAVVALKIEYQPTAVLPEPVVRFFSAFCPSAVLEAGIASVWWRDDSFRDRLKR